MRSTDPHQNRAMGLDRFGAAPIDFSVGSNGSSVILGQAINLGRQAV